MQVAKAVEFVQDEVRYTGINSGVGGFKPDAPDAIFKRRFGDCKDKTILIVSLLKELGVEAYPALVHSREGNELTELLPSPDVFDHVIVHVPNLNDKSYWLDGTITQQGRKLNSKFQVTYHNALVVGTKGDGLTSYNHQTPDLPEKEITEIYNLRYNHDDAPSVFTVTSILRGYEAELFRRKIQRNGVSELQDNYLDYYQRSYPGIERSEDVTMQDDRDNNEITIVEKYLITDAWEESSSDDIAFNFSIYADSITGDLRMPEERRRKEPLAQIHPVFVKHTIVLRMRDGWDIDDAERKIGNKYFSYTEKESVTGKELKLTYELKTLKDTVSVQDSRKYLKDLEEMLDSRYYSVYHNIGGEEAVDENSLLYKLGQWLVQ